MKYEERNLGAKIYYAFKRGSFQHESFDCLKSVAGLLYGTIKTWSCKICGEKTKNFQSQGVKLVLPHLFFSPLSKISYVDVVLPHMIKPYRVMKKNCTYYY